MKKQKLKRNLLMAAMLFGAILIGGAESNVYAQNGGLIGSGNDNGYYGSGYRDNGGGTLGSGTRTEEENPPSSPEDNGVIASGSNSRAEAGGMQIFSWRSIRELFF